MNIVRDIKYPELAFRYGFLFRRVSDGIDVDFLRDWKRIEIDGFLLQLHPDTKVTVKATEVGTALLIGDAFVCVGDESIDDVLVKLLLGRNWDDLDRLAGRFALLLVRNGECMVMHDPFGSRTVYYKLTSPFGVSSHAALLAAVFSCSIDKGAQSFIQMPEYRARGTSYLPGDATIYQDIKALIPNNFFDSSLGKSCRFWPRRPVARTTMDEFLDACDLYFQRFADFLRNRYKPVLGVTGGVDTRAVIAGFMGKGLKVRLVTWTGGRLPDAEVSVVAQMVSHLNQPHEYINPRTPITAVKLNHIADATRAATGFCRETTKLLTANMGAIAQDGEVFIRGYGGEIIRGFYNRHRANFGGDIVTEFFDLYKTSRVLSPRLEFTRFASNAIAEFVDRTDYDTKLHGLDLRDAYYWEQRMGVWGSNMLNEMDPAIYSMAGLNSRPLYEAAFGLPEKERLGAEIMIKITERYDRKFARMKVSS